MDNPTSTILIRTPRTRKRAIRAAWWGSANWDLALNALIGVTVVMGLILGTWMGEGVAGMVAPNSPISIDRTLPLTLARVNDVVDHVSLRDGTRPIATTIIENPLKTSGVYRTDMQNFLTVATKDPQQNTAMLSNGISVGANQTTYVTGWLTNGASHMNTGFERADWGTTSVPALASAIGHINASFWTLSHATHADVLIQPLTYSQANQLWSDTYKDQGGTLNRPFAENFNDYAKTSPAYLVLWIHTPRGTSHGS